MPILVLETGETAAICVSLSRTEDTGAHALQALHSDPMGKIVTMVRTQTLSGKADELMTYRLLDYKLQHVNFWVNIVGMPF